jgi:hypothetical protein
MDDASLTNLKANASRLQFTGGAQSEAALALLPLIDAELAVRLSRKPVKVTKARVRRVPAIAAVAAEVS